MGDSQRSSNIRELYATRAFVSIAPGVIGILATIPMFVFDRQGFTLGLRWVLVLAGSAAIAYGVRQLIQMRKVSGFDVLCPFCQSKNVFSSQPMDDVRCESCNREVPIHDGRVLRVFQVRCGFCNTLNWYSEKSTGLLCEECDRAIPIATEDDSAVSPALRTYSRQDDNAPYNLVLIDAGLKTEEMILVLQKMLALNRNQVKDIIGEVPVVLLQGVSKKKAELMAAQIQSQGGRANFSPTP